MKKMILANLCVLMTALTACTQMTVRNIPFDDGWRFVRDSLVGAETADYDDSGWLTIDLPHDYSIMDLPGYDSDEQIGPFSRKSPGNGNSTGHVIGGTGWYRKHFTVNPDDRDKTATLLFDGVYMETEVWVNGQKVGEHKNGYTPFYFDITKHLAKAGQVNVVAVKVDNTGRNSRWYSGSGIYRNVTLMLTDPLHITPWGVCVSTSQVSARSADVEVVVIIANDGDADAQTEVNIQLSDPSGKKAGTAAETIRVAAGKESSSSQTISLANPLLWSINSPNLYTAEISISKNGKIIDTYSQTFGIRSIQFTANKGFLLNGETVLLKGGCIHHDNGLLGSAAFARAEERKIELLKSYGFNAIRLSHNPPSTALLDACDRLGMVVIDEFTDMWETHKNPDDYSRFFAEWWNSDLTAMMLRDRNHPSVIMWSIGNEIFETDENNRLRIARDLTARVRELDPTRPVTQAITEFFYTKGWDATAEAFAITDICGYNYMLDKIESDHRKYPDRIIYTSESYCKSAYDYWKAVEKYPYVIGDFIWTAWDYMGEVGMAETNYVPPSEVADFMGNFSNIKLPEGVNIFDMLVDFQASAWNAFQNPSGDIDLTGEKKSQLLYKDILWGNSALEMVVHEPIPDGLAESGTLWAWSREYPHWTWNGSEGKKLQVRVFTKAPQVRLLLNGQTVGEATLNEADKYIATFDVPYSTGELKAIAMDGNQTVATKTFVTAGAPAAIRLAADRSAILADRNDLCFIKIEITDRDGNLVPLSDSSISLSVDGDGELIACGNTDIRGMKSFNHNPFEAWRGKAQAIIRPFNKQGEITVRATAKNLEPAILKIKVSNH
ncbi:MAG: DUF4982 domain-containing protein [Tannerella sp.]|nr:DUF4982 domain-containing protein [Tannerella sp.]